MKKKFEKCTPQVAKFCLNWHRVALDNLDDWTKTENNSSSNICSYSSISISSSHRRRQQWGTGACALLSTYDCLIFKCTLAYTKSDSDYMLTVASCKHLVTFVPLLWRHGVVVMEFVVSTKLLYVEPG